MKKGLKTTHLVNNRHDPNLHSAILREIHISNILLMKILNIAFCPGLQTNINILCVPNTY